MPFDSDYAALLYEYLSAHGFDPVEVLGEPLPQSESISAERWQAMLECAARTCGEAAFGLRVGESFQLRHLGLIGYLLMSCANSLEVLQRAQRFKVLISGVNPLHVYVESDQLVLSWPLLNGWCGQLQDEMGLATTVQLARMLFGANEKLARVDFVGATPDSLKPYQSFFNCEVRFEQAMPRLVLPLSHLSLPVLGADAGLCRLLDAQAEQRLQQLMPVDADMQQLRQQLLRLIRDGQPRLAALAACSGLSVRALQRRFTARRSSFQMFLENTRRHLSEQYLIDSRLSLSDIADLLGYADQSTFTRAFSQWKGCSPGAWRHLHAYATASRQSP